MKRLVLARVEYIDPDGTRVLKPLETWPRPVWVDVPLWGLQSVVPLEVWRVPGGAHG